LTAAHIIDTATIDIANIRAMSTESRQESIGFLVGALLRRKGLAFRTLLAPYQITPRQYAVLSRLWQEDGLPLTELARRLYADPSSLCRTILLMEKAGLIRRQRDAADRRVFRLRLSKQGRALKRQLRPLVQAHDEDTVRRLSPAEITAVADVLRRMLVNLGGTPADADTLPDDDDA
jgi:MarR family transcriptional regulator, organic hydroperoxide resistance regulator